MECKQVFASPPPLVVVYEQLRGNTDIVVKLEFDATQDHEIVDTKHKLIGKKTTRILQSIPSNMYISNFNECLLLRSM